MGRPRYSQGIIEATLLEAFLAGVDSVKPDHLIRRHVQRLGVDARQALHDFDSHGFFNQAGGHISTGPTLTNVMDITIVHVEA